MENYSQPNNRRSLYFNSKSNEAFIRAISPVWFCLALNPLSELLTKSGIGYKLNKKTRTPNISQIEINFNKGKTESGGMELEMGSEIEAMGENEVYKYLAYQQARNNHEIIPEALIKEYITRVRRICKTGLKSNLFKSINTFAIPVVTYSFGLFKWTETDLDEKKTRTEMTKFRNHHPKASVLALPRK